MTCIAAVVNEGDVWMGADSAGIDAWSLSLQTGTETKVWLNGPFIFGACGSFRVAQLVRYHMVLPEHEAEQDTLAYITGPFVDALRWCLSEGGSLTGGKNKAEELTASGLLVGYEGRIFEMYEDFGVGEYADGFAANGCGGPYALGALYATKDQPPKPRIKQALKASERYSGGVRGPFTILRLQA